MFVPVVDQHQHPLMPTTPARARRWIQSGKATAFWKGGLFCVRLNVEPAARALQPIAVGIDPGSKREGIKVSTKSGQRRWNQRFSPLEVGKQWFYEELAKLAPVQTKQGYETKALREQLGCKKTSKKLAEVWEAHCVDAWVLASRAVGGNRTPDNRRLVCIAPLSWHHRQLHKTQPAKGGKRRREGGTLSQGIKRGTLVKHPSYGKAYVGGTMDGKLSLHHPQTGKRLTQRAKAVDCQLLKLLRWRTRLGPVTPLHRKRQFHPRSLGTGHLQAQVR